MKIDQEKGKKNKCFLTGPVQTYFVLPFFCLSKVVATRISKKNIARKKLKLILQVFIDSSKVFASLHELASSLSICHKQQLFPLYREDEHHSIPSSIIV